MWRFEKLGLKMKHASNYFTNEDVAEAISNWFTRGRRILKNTEKITILYINVHDFVIFFYPKNGIICFINVWNL